MGCCCSKLRRYKRRRENQRIKRGLEIIRDSETPIIWVVGGPGSGRCMLCERLAVEYCFKHVSMGDILRAEMDIEGSKWGPKIILTLTNGDLVPWDICLSLLKKALVDTDLSFIKGFLIDGYPRTVKEAEEFDDQVGHCSMILYLNCEDRVMVERLLSDPRREDTIPLIKKRLRFFHWVTIRLVNSQIYSPLVATIDANGEPHEVFNLCKEYFDAVYGRQGSDRFLTQLRDKDTILRETKDKEVREKELKMDKEYETQEFQEKDQWDRERGKITREIEKELGGGKKESKDPK